ncbi:MAG: hypothetical protein LBB43_02360, partial [Spirochaetaceae bacterium]|nr:hypothetical protein [Spirochaetaceae bacterium]
MYREWRGARLFACKQAGRQASEVQRLGAVSEAEVTGGLSPQKDFSKRRPPYGRTKFRFPIE